ncbi:hypothetical protein CFC21_034699 [Triticum aestivum]|uniref:F-box domain-containing protein n=3 Tax=Triticum TaxID=4564 RepID=A0A9R0REM3_TRITD|nr:probable F-box protein At3g61730 [Triticum dicoccoides]XP_044339452.1 probable F-box protein At3g61730 isoform X1 [Triticum aestivum]KAF7021808.1 hypothetical protein CFC21_034699 [Triticum aestivum]VAH59034.1 unnamed protein product [Triticum turgidum subsp. durum]
MGKAFSLLRPEPQPQREPGEGMVMELRKRPRPRRLDPDFVSSPPPTPPRKRPRKQDAERKQPPRRPAAAQKPPAPSKRARCVQQGIGSPVAGLQPSRCCRIVAPLSRVSFIPRSRVPFNWYEPDIWTEVAKHLHGADLLRLSATCLWFFRLLYEDSIWRYAFLRDLSLRTNDPKMLRLLHVPRPFHRSWRLLYATAFDDTHAYCFRQPEKHIEWFRIGGFLMDTPKLLLTAKLALPPWRPILDDGPEISIGFMGACLLTNVRPGIWIADMNMVRCPVCNLNKCEGTMQVLDARHCELYLENKFRDGTWEYEDLGSHFSNGKLDTAAAAIFNYDYIDSPCIKNILNSKSWIRDRTNLLPKGCFTPVAVALSSNLKPNEGLLSRFQAMRDMSRGGQIVSVRITQQLL